jgi:thiamine biosynthesis lipoprotein
VTQRSATSIDIASQGDKRTSVRRVEHVMGTVFSIDVRGPGCDPVEVEHIIDWLHWVDRTFSTYQACSDISRLSRGEIVVTDCAPEVAEVLGRCQELEVETSGFFSAFAAGPLDPSGLVKGWAIQRASDMLKAAGSTDHCVNGGGDVHCAGRPAAGQLWRVGIADPLEPGRIAGIVAGTDIAVATSGSAERGAHIVDPRTRTSPELVASVTLVGSDLATTDAYATAAFAMGHDAGAWIETLEDFRGLVIFADGRQWHSSDFALQS